MQSEGSSYKVTIFLNSEKSTGLHPLLSGIGNERVLMKWTPGDLIKWTHGDLTSGHMVT